MRSLTRLMLLALAALLLGLPVFGDESEGGGGDSGVWILPRAGTQMTLQLSSNGRACIARDSRVVLPATALVMQMPPEMTVPLAVLREMPSNVALATSVSGNRVTLPPRTLQAVVNPASSGYAEGVIIDGLGRGFRIVLVRAANDLVRVEIY